MKKAGLVFIGLGALVLAITRFVGQTNMRTEAGNLFSRKASLERFSQNRSSDSTDQQLDEVCSGLKLDGVYKTACERMKESKVYHAIRSALRRELKHQRSRVVLLEGGWYAWGGYQGSLWTRNDKSCSVIAGEDGERDEVGLRKIKEIDVSCNEFDALWAELITRGVWDVSSHFESSQPKSEDSPAEYVFRGIIDGGTFFMFVKDLKNSKLFGAYEPCRLKGVEPTVMQCEVMRSVSDATEKATRIRLGPRID